jgi:hypothetical protein
MAEAMADLQEGMARVTEIQEANNAAPRPVGVTSRIQVRLPSTEIRRWERREPRRLRETPRASKPRRPRAMEALI